MNDLVVKNVDLFGDTIVAAQDSDGVIWAGVRWFCNGLGLSDGQRQRQTTNIGEDIVLSQGVANLHLPTNGGKQDVLCLKLEFVPLWLAKISITPNMKESNPELVDKLIKYQLQAKDVLARAFLPQEQTQILPKDFASALRLAADEYEKRVLLEQKNEALTKENARMRPKEIFADAVSVSDTEILIGELAKIIKQNGVNMGQNRLFEWMRDNGYLVRRKGTDYNMPMQNAMEMGLFEIKERTINNPDGSVRITKTVLVSGKGQQYFINKFLNKSA